MNGELLLQLVEIVLAVWSSVLRWKLLLLPYKDTGEVRRELNNAGYGPCLIECVVGIVDLLGYQWKKVMMLYSKGFWR